MAFLFIDPRSPYWQAGWKDENGKRANRTTRIKAKQSQRKLAQKLADAFEDAARKKIASRHMRQTISDLHNRITDREMAVATTREYVKLFLERKKGETAEATLRYYQTATRDFLSWLDDQADNDINDIRPSDIIRFRNHLLERISETTVTNKMKAIRAMFASAHKEGVCLEEPTASLQLSRKAKQSINNKKRAFTIDELRLIKATASGEWISMIMFGLYTGQRLGDVATLRWSNIDTVAEEVRLVTAKTGQLLRIPMAPPLCDLIESLDSSDDPTAFIHPHSAISYEEKGSSTLSNQFSNILASCGLRKPVSHKSKEKGRNAKREAVALSFHSLRSTAVTLLHEAGIPQGAVEAWVGHESSEVHQTYIKIGKETLSKASNALPKI